MARIVELSQLPSNPYGVHYTDEDNMDICRLIAEHQASVDILDAELERLSQKRTYHIKLIERGKSALAPHSKLPLEIIRKIIWQASDSMITIISFEWAEFRKNILPT